MRILFATPETCDFVQVGGLAAVSAALPRALLPLADIRVVVPGYPQVRRGLANLKIVGDSPGFAGLPSFRVGKGHATDGMPYYVVICPELLERPGSPYSDEHASIGRTMTSASQRSPTRRLRSLWAASIRTGLHTLSTPMTGNAR